MHNAIRSSLAALACATALAACGGQGADDTLADGAVDRPAGGNNEAVAEDAGPPGASPAAAAPASAASGAGTGADAPGGGAAQGVTLAVSAQGPEGAYITDSAGVALYRLEGDRDGSGCTGDCLIAWPPVLMGATQPSGAAGLQGALISSVARPDGSRQVTFGGQPLYRYAADGGVGGTNGHGVKDRYGTWRLVSPQGAAAAGE